LSRVARRLKNTLVVVTTVAAGANTFEATRSKYYMQSFMMA
jgi:hypothetical protein